MYLALGDRALGKVENHVQPSPGEMRAAVRELHSCNGINKQSDRSDITR